MIKLYQILITSEDSRRINQGEQLPIYKAHCDALCLGKFPGREFYTHVADLDSVDLEEAFHIGNMGPEDKITRHADMHSVSVGDVLETEIGFVYIVKPRGFDVVPGWSV